jgi:hypothetical protein
MKLLIIVAIVFSISSATHNPECVCIKDPHPSPAAVKSDRRQNYDRAAAVFVGRVVSLDAYVVKFRLEKRWKGNAKDEIILSTGAVPFPDASHPLPEECNYAFSLGEEYLVYAYLNDQKLKADRCATLKAKDAADEENGLDEIKPHEVVKGVSN